MDVTIRNEHGEEFVLSTDEYHTIDKKVVGPNGEFKDVRVFDGPPESDTSRYDVYRGSEIVKVEQP